LVGNIAKKSSADALGSIAYLTAGKHRQQLDVVSGGVYCSQNDLTLHFEIGIGLGEATKVEKLELHWTSGAVESFTVRAIDKIVTIVEGKGASR
jgi:hypothetical protein